MADFVIKFTMADQDQDPKSDYWTVYIDESSVSGMGEVGVVLLSPKKDILRYGVQFKFPTTNNEV